jgi:hypothetical protein
MERQAADRLPEPVNPAALPRRLMHASAVVILGGLLMLLLGAVAAGNADEAGRTAPLLPPDVLLAGWLLSVPVGGALLAAYAVLGRLRLTHFERRAGFLPRPGRKDLPATGRKTLFRLEYGSRGEHLCLMVARWDYGASTGWRRGAVVEHGWVDGADAVAVGEQRARFEALAEDLEERMDDARLAGDGERVLLDESLSERRAAGERTHRLAEELARD